MVLRMQYWCFDHSLDHRYSQNFPEGGALVKNNCGVNRVLKDSGCAFVVNGLLSQNLLNKLFKYK